MSTTTSRIHRARAARLEAVVNEACRAAALVDAARYKKDSYENNNFLSER